MIDSSSLQTEEVSSSLSRSAAYLPILQIETAFEHVEPQLASSRVCLMLSLATRISFLWEFTGIFFLVLEQHIYLSGWGCGV